MGLVLSEGHIESWTVSIFSPFGLYPYSFYPIGVPLLLACLLNLGFSYEASVFLISEVMGLLGALGAYCLGRYMFKSNKKGLAYAFLYSVSPIFLRVTYYTITVRGPFMAVLPWFLLFSWKLYKERRIKYLARSFLSFLILALTHRLSLLMLLYLGVILGAFLLLQTAHMLAWIRSKLPSFLASDNPDAPSSSNGLVLLRLRISKLESFLRERGCLHNLGIVQIILFGTLLAGTYLVAFMIIPIDPRKTTEVFLPNSTFIGVTTNLIIDYGLRLGIASVFWPIGFLHKLDYSYRSSGWAAHLAMMMVVLFILPRSLYASLILLPVFTYYTLVGIDVLIEKFTTRIIGISVLLGAVVFTVIYHFFVVEMGLYLLLASSLLFICLISLVPRRSSFLSGYHWHMLILGILLFSMVSVDGLIQGNPNCFLDAEEMAIIDFLRGQSETGIVFVGRSDFARRIQAYSIPVVIRESIGITSIYYDWIEPEQVIQWTVLDLNIAEIMKNGQFFEYIAPFPELAIWIVFFNTDLTNQTQASIAIELGLRFIIVEKTRDGFSSFVEEIPYPSPLLKSAPIACEAICETENMVLFMLS